MKLFRRSRSTPELRRCYRRPPGTELPTRILALGELHPARATDLSADGAGLDLSLLDPLPMVLDRKVVRLALELPRRLDTIETEALVVRDTLSEHGRHLGLRFRDTEELARRLSGREFQLFNRRHEPRVPPPSSERLPLTVDPEGLCLRVLARDLSRDGIGFAVDEAGRAVLQERSEWIADLRLPGQVRPVRVALALRHLTAVARGHQIGAVFAEQRRRTHALLRAEIGDYVRERRAQLARWPWFE